MEKRLKTEAQPDPLPVGGDVDGPANPKAAQGATKPNLGLLPPVGLLHAAMAFEDGARKYGPYNWRDKPVDAMTYVAAAKRHLDSFQDRQDLTDDTNVHNLGAVIACCLILLDCQELGTLIDSRPPPGPGPATQNRLKKQKIHEAAERAAKDKP